MGTHPFVRLALIGDSLGCTEGDQLGLLAPFEPMLSCGSAYLFQELFTDATNDTGFSNTRATPQYVVTDTNALYPVPAGAIPIRGARPVRSLVKDVVPTAESTSFSAWTAVNTASISGDGLTVSFLSTGDTIRLDVSTDGVQNGRTYAASFWLTGNGTLTLRVRDRFGAGPDDIGDQVVTLTSTPQRFSVAHQFSDDQTNGIRVYLLRGASDTATEAVLQSPGYLIQEITHRAALSTAPDEFIDPDTDYGTGVAGFRYFLTALANTVDGSGVVTEATGAALSNISLANVPGSTNLADGTHDFSGGADTITLSATGYYTLWLEGTAQVTIAAGTATITGAGSATEGNPVTINCTATGTVTLTLDSGTLDEVSGSQVIMLESGTVPTAFIPTSGSTASTDSAVLDFSGVTGFATPNETRVVATGLNASLEPDPTDTTERNVDVDDWDGTDLSDILPHANIKSVTVYAPGERP